MLNTTSRRLTIGLAVGALTLFGAAGVFAAAEGPGGGQRAAAAQTADDGGGPNPMCMVRPQDCMQPPGSGGGNGQPGSGQGGGTGG